MIHLIKLNGNYANMYYCTDDNDEYQQILEKSGVVPDTGLSVDISDIISIPESKNETGISRSCRNMVGSVYENVEIALMEKPFVDFINDTKIYKTEHPFYVNMNENKNIKIQGLIQCIAVFIKSNDGGLIGFHHVTLYRSTLDEKNKLQEALSLMRLHDMNSSNSKLSFYYVPGGTASESTSLNYADVLEEQNKSINNIREELGFEDIEKINIFDSTVIYGERHLEKRLPKYKCRICDVDLPTFPYMEPHMTIHHNRAVSEAQNIVGSLD